MVLYRDSADLENRPGSHGFSTMVRRSHINTFFKDMHKQKMNIRFCENNFRAVLLFLAGYMLNFCGH